MPRQELPHQPARPQRFCNPEQTPLVALAGLPLQEVTDAQLGAYAHMPEGREQFPSLGYSVGFVPGLSRCVAYTSLKLRRGCPASKAKRTQSTYPTIDRAW